jgi:hypothetical protein
MKEITHIMTIEITSIGEIDDRTFEKTFNVEEWKKDIANDIEKIIRDHARFSVDDIHTKVQTFVMEKNEGNA